MYKYIHIYYIINVLPIYFILLTVLTKGCILGPDNGIANAYIEYGRDRIVWRVGVILTGDKHPRSAWESFYIMR